MINACIIGVSGFGRVHYTDLMKQVEAGRMRVVAATVINEPEEPEKCAKLRSVGAKIFTDSDEMFREFAGKADLCFIPTGISFHEPMSIAAMRAGMNVYVEKPAAATIQEVRNMQAVERETGKFVAVGFQDAFSDDTVNLKHRLVSGEFGKIKRVAVQVAWPRASKYYERNWWAGRLRARDRWILDSPFNNATAHYITLMCFFAGAEFREAARLATVQAELHRAKPIESPDTAAIRAITEDGIPLLYLGTHSCREYFGPDIRIETENASIVWQREAIVITNNDGATERLPLNEDLREPVMRHLMERVTNPHEFICSLDIAAVHTLYVNGAHESSDIHVIPAEHTVTTEGEEGTLIAVDRMEQIIHDCYESELLFSEAGVPWAKASAPVDVRNYNEFTGGAIGTEK